MKNRTFIFLVLVLLITLYVVIYNAEQQKNGSNQTPCIKVGSPIDYFDLIGVGGEFVDRTILAGNKISTVFIFKQPCFSCDRNVHFWKKIKRNFNRSIHAYGVILADTTELPELGGLEKTGFSILKPRDSGKFMAEFNVKHNLSQTIIIHDGRVIFSKSGEITVEDYFAIRNIIKKRVVPTLQKTFDGTKSTKGKKKDVF